MSAIRKVGDSKVQNLKKYMPIVLLSLRQKKLRTVLSMLGVIFGVIAVTTMFSIGEGAKRKTLRQIEQLGVRNIILKTLQLTGAQEIQARENLAWGLSAGDVRRLQGIPQIESISPLRELKASVIGVSRELYPEVVGVTRAFGEVEEITPARGRFISDLDMTRRNPVCVLGFEISTALGSKGKLGAFIRIENEMFKVIGILGRREFDSVENSILKTRDLNRLILIPLTAANYVEPVKFRDHYSEVVLRVSHKDYIFSASESVRAMMGTFHGTVKDYRMVVPLELLNKQKQTQGNFNMLLGAIAFISLLVGGIGIMNIMLANVSERRREIGIRRAIGANRGHIKLQFLLEAVLISLIGGVLGLIAAVLLVFIISLVGDWEMVLSFWIVFFSLSMAVVVGIGSGIYPAIRASEQDPIEALR
ncbi:MAG: ABC transporter permease [bacterium]|nr:ABC transporter permease [bacterium]